MDLSGKSIPHFNTIQPEWKYLPYVCELNRLLFEQSVSTIDELQPVIEAKDRSKAKELCRFMDRLDLITDSDHLEIQPNGVWLRALFQPPAQQGLFDADVPHLGRKKRLSETEQQAFITFLFSHHLLPMLATLKQLAAGPIEPTDQRAIAEFKSNLDHLEDYADLNEGAWETRLGIHYTWCDHLDLAEKNGRGWTLTRTGKTLYQQLASGDFER